MDVSNITKKVYSHNYHLIYPVYLVFAESHMVHTTSCINSQIDQCTSSPSEPFFYDIYSTMSTHRSDIVKRLVMAQDDGDSVVLPNACKGELIEMQDDTAIRCFSVLTRQPYTIPPESWSLLTTGEEMPAVAEHDNVTSGFLVDHVTRGFIGDNAFRVQFDADNRIESIRLLPPGSGPAQQQWEAQANKMIECPEDN